MANLRNAIKSLFSDTGLPVANIDTRSTVIDKTKGEPRIQHEIIVKLSPSDTDSLLRSSDFPEIHQRATWLTIINSDDSTIQEELSKIQTLAILKGIITEPT